MADLPPLRFGVLSTSSIIEAGLMWPCVQTGVATIAALASRDKALATEYVQARGEALKDCKVFDSYQQLLDNADVDCVYIPLPNSMHYEWTIKALNAGKHVLVEKPFAGNAEEAKEMVRVAKEKGLLCMEAQHWYYHPVRAKLLEIVQSGSLGKLEEIKFSFRMKMGLPPITLKRAGTFDTKTSSGKMWIMKEGMCGGISMTLGTYVLNIVRTMIGEEPEVLNASAQCLADDAELEAAMKGELNFPKAGVKGVFDWTGMGPEAHFNEMWITGTDATLYLEQFMEPQLVPNKIKVTTTAGNETVTEVDAGGLTTYMCQLLAFVDNVRQVNAGSAEADSFANTGSAPIRQMEVIDRCYLAAGMHPRSGPSGLLSKVKWPDVPNMWRVVGGADKGGILVRAGEDKESEQLPDRLSTGAEIEELELKKDRLHYKKVTGDGPDEGWVSLKVSGKPLVVLLGGPPGSIKLAKKQMDGKPRILCLHGTASGTKIMEAQFAKLFQKLGADVDHFILESMKTCPPIPTKKGAKVTVTQEAVEIMSQFFPGKPMMMYDELTFDDKHWRCYKKPADTLFWIQQMMKKHGPFDGVLGFSQGANFAIMLAAMSYVGTGKPLSCCVAICPNAPGYKNQLPELFEAPLPVPTLIIRGEDEQYDSGVEKFLANKKIDTCGEDMPSAHVVSLFKDPQVWSHPDGHRPMPVKPDDQEEMIEKIRKFIVENACFEPVLKS